MQIDSKMVATNQSKPDGRRAQHAFNLTPHTCYLPAGFFFSYWVPAFHAKYCKVEAMYQTTLIIGKCLFYVK